MDWFTRFLKVVEGLDPVIEAVAAMVFPENPLAAKAAKYGIGLVRDAEAAWGRGKGPVKKEFVMKGASDFLSGLIDCSTGGQKDTLMRFTPFMNALVDGVVAGTNGVDTPEGDGSRALPEAGCP
jgi:hypothetical protein